MAISNEERVEDLLISWRRQADGSLVTFASRTNLIEEVDDATSPPSYTPMRHTLAAAVDGTDVEAIVGDQLPALIAERDALQAQLTQAQADKQAALDAQATAEAALSSMTDARDALQDQLDAIQNPPVDHVISQRFKLALDQLGLLDTVDQFISGQSREVQLRWDFPEFYRNDTMLNQLAGVLVAFLPDPPTNDANALLDQVFALAKTIT